MDSVLLYGSHDTRLTAFLERLGYAVVAPSDVGALRTLVDATVDIIVLDGRDLPDVSDMCAFFRAQKATKEVPIICICSHGDENSSEPLPEFPSGVESVMAPYSVGALVGKIATQLRLRKLAGDEDAKASLAQVNMALRDHNERFKRELKEARSIQESLLPGQLPRDARFDLAVSYQALEDVGGDWYSVQKEDDGSISFQIADVSGHGLAAAFISSMTKLATIAAHDLSVQVHLAKTAGLLGGQLPGGRFVTMAMCRYDPQSGLLQWSRAGHPSALLLRRRTGEVLHLKGDGFPVGFVEAPQYELIQEHLEPGDVLALFTDGLIEVQNRALQVFGFDQLGSALLASNAQDSAAHILESIVDAVDEFREGRLLKDDLTLIVLKRID